MTPDDLVPLPQEVRPGEGRLTPEGPWLVGGADLEHAAVRFKLREELRVDVSAMDLPPHALTAGPSPQLPEPPEREQAYAIRITPGGIGVRGHDADGLYWGLVTLEQLLEGGGMLPCGEIRDWPAFRLRGHHDDISRGQVSTADDFRRIVRLLSRYKINVYTPYMEDMLCLASHPDIGEGRGRLTPADVAALHEEAARHNVLIIPTYSLIGHQENLLRDPRYAHLGRAVFQPMSSLDVRKPEVRDFLSEVIRDACELFPGPYFHGAFDETQGIGAEGFIDHANWCARELAGHGKRMLMWADMFCNHFGHERIRDLDESIIPVNWQYGTGPVAHQAELAAQGRPVWGLAAYSNTCTFLPDSSRGRANMDAWVRAGLETESPALFCSQWGDHGYENHRDMCWNSFAYLGEAAWSGGRARARDFERRFQVSFYGCELPELEAIVTDLPGRLALKPRDFWELHRCNATSLVRWAAANADAGPALESDEEQIGAALASLAGCRERAVRETENPEHFRVALLRMLSVVRRLRFSLAWVAGMAEDALRDAVACITRELAEVRRAHEADWLRTNKRPNVEISLGVFDEVLASYEELSGAKPAGGGAGGRHLPLDLATHYNRDFLPVGGVPIGPGVVNDVPFLFAGADRTHVSLTGGSGSLALDFPETGVSDVHLIIAGHRTSDLPTPAALLELERRGEVVHSERLMDIAHLCDWWAPLGEHIWAGGGMAHVDPGRVRYGLKPGSMYGLAHLSDFGLPAGARADRLRLAALGEGEVRVFAITLET